MPRFFFNVTDGHRTYPDPLGCELAGPEEARRHALDDARMLLESWMVRSSAPWRVLVADEEGRTILALSLPDAAVSEAHPLFGGPDDLAA
jgi:hypothetical protein